MTSKIVYRGTLRTEAEHLQSGTIIYTDAPVDNHGKGEKFSPTDLVATALGSCMMTIMGIKAQEMNISLEGTTLEVTKVMGTEPRRIIEIIVSVAFPPALSSLDAKDKTIIERVAVTCPVAKSLHPELLQTIHFKW